MLPAAGDRIEQRCDALRPPRTGCSPGASAATVRRGGPEWGPQAGERNTQNMPCDVITRDATGYPSSHPPPAAHMRGAVKTAQVLHCCRLCMIAANFYRIFY